MSPTYILSTIKAFLSGSAGEPDGLRPQHLNDLTSESAGDAGHRLVVRLAEFANLIVPQKAVFLSGFDGVIRYTWNLAECRWHLETGNTTMQCPMEGSEYDLRLS